MNLLRRSSLTSFGEISELPKNRHHEKEDPEHEHGLFLFVQKFIRK
jgi:hypothetical protein